MTYVKIILAIGLLIGGYFAYNRAYDQGKKEGAAVVQEAWDIDKASIQKTADAAIAQSTKDKEAALTDNEGIIHDLQAQLDSARGLNTQLGDSLRNHQARPAASSGAVLKTGGGPAVNSAPAAPSVGSVDGLLGNALEECYATRVNYEALIREITPQL